MRKVWLGALSVAVIAAAVACGDDDDSDESTATATSEGGSATASATSEEPAATGLDPDFGDAGILAAALDPAAHDRFMAVAIDDDGNAYATGFLSQGGDQAMVVAKFTSDGSPDAAFGEDGVAIVNVSSGGKTAEISRAVVLMENGKIVIGGPVEHDTSATGDAAKDTDIAVVRLNDDGSLDEDFGEEGIAIFDLGAGRQVSENSFVGDNSWGIADRGDGKVVVWASALAEGEGRTDSDLVLFGVTDDGAMDEEFGEAGKVVVDIDNASLNPRGVIVEDDGKIVATGYGNLGGVVQPIFVRTDDSGELDSGFGEGGIATAAVLPGVAESYAVARQGDSYISAGYGRGADTAEKVDLIVDRWDDAGVWDESFGSEGVARLDLEGQDDRARNVVVLPDGRILAIGSGKLTEANVDAMVALLSEDGEFDAEFGTDGYILSELGGPNDAFFGGAISPDGKFIIVAGYKGVDQAGTDNDDAVLAKILIG